MAYADLEIKSTRVRLRLARGTDLEFLHRLYTNPLSARYTKTGQLTNTEQSRAKLEEVMALKPPDTQVFIVETIPDKVHSLPRPIGICGSPRVHELGYGLHPEYWGKGYATEAAQAYMKWYYEQHPDATLFAATYKVNEASKRVLVALGFSPALDADRGLVPSEFFGSEDLEAFVDRKDRHVK